MTARKLFLFAFLASFLFSNSLTGQCSDAGVCAIGYTPVKTEKNISFDVLYRYGYSGKDDKINYKSFELKSAIKVFDKTSFLISLPFYRYHTGPSGTATGIGDLMAYLNQDFGNFYNSNLSVLLGMRLATGNSNENPQLPQSYQPGLGTNDVIFGLKFSGVSYSFSTGYQYVEKTFTKNELTPIRRGDDLYFQFAYLFRLDDLSLKGDIQMIKRLDKTDLRNPDGTVTELEKTDQMQINIGAEAYYDLSGTHSLIAGFAFPILKRETNIDGLTRVFTFWAGWRVSL